MRVSQRSIRARVTLLAAGSAVVLLGSLTLVLDAAVIAAAGVAVAAGTAWWGTGRALRPVARVRAELDAIGAGRACGRVTVASGDGEAARLGASVNLVLERLVDVVERQRAFAADASHELRTPIAGLRANLEEAVLYPDDVDVKEVLNSALRDADRLEAITTDLLLLVRVKSCDPAAREPVDLSDLLREGLAARVPAPSADLATGLRVHAVPTQVARLVDNLLDNAERHADGRVEVTLRRDGDHAVVTVADDGPGIPAADRERVFERFTRLDTARSRCDGGTGLGLAIAREIACAHGGVLTAEEPGARGARLVLRLPVS
ncbi:sensor histidine kinase [Actinomadura flavalba]|uniref:sensor histidine kinase n=1 Tax=Actinomadura flavalba TaxID=1120938 RepID=UPI003B82E175